MLGFRVLFKTGIEAFKYLNPIFILVIYYQLNKY